MATDIAFDLDEQLVECKTALQNQARDMLTTLVQFEERLKARLDAAEARLASLRSESESLAARANNGMIGEIRESTADPAVSI